MWVPELHTSDTNWFNENPEEVFKGQSGVDGNLSGIAYTARKGRTCTWPWIKAENVIERANSGTSFEADRCFVKVVNDARTKVLAQTGSGNVYCKGVYFIEDMDTYVGIGILPTSWDSGTPNVSNALFCAAGPPVIDGASDSEQKAWYDLQLKLTAAVAPVWTWDITP
jgi:hypothetical protein